MKGTNRKVTKTNMTSTRVFADTYFPLYEQVKGTKPKLSSRDWFFVKRWYEKNFYECLDVMEAVIRRYFGSDLGTKGDYSLPFLMHKGVTLQLLDEVRDSMKRGREWEQGTYSKEKPRIENNDDVELNAMMDRLQKQVPGMGYDAYLSLAKKRLNR